MEKLTMKEYFLLSKLDSLYKALSLTAVAPVVISSENIDIELGKIISPEKNPENKVKIFSHQYWDTLEHESYACRIMQERVSLGQSDLKEHSEIHNRLDSDYGAIRESVFDGNKTDFENYVSAICQGVTDYNDLVRKHSKEFKEPFLDYPVCVKGHFYHIPNLRFQHVESSFNPSQDYEGSASEVDSIEELLEEASPHSFNTSGLHFIQPAGSNLLSKNLATNKLLLERVPKF